MTKSFSVEVNDFDAKHTFECGQCFRWNRELDGSYTGVALGKVINVLIKDNILTIKNSDEREFYNIWQQYFDLITDYSKIKEELRNKDDILKKAVDFGWGIRLLKQELWETIISFIISSNNGIPRIKKIIETISKQYGAKIITGNKEYYTFPEVETLSSTTLEKLDVCRGGYRCRYILETSLSVDSKEIIPEKIKAMDVNEAREYLKKLTGIGDKVADCILLFSGTKMNVFPTDKWVKRVMEELYFGKETSLKEIQAFSSSYFGDLAGYAQQYLFYYARENKIGV